MHLSSFWLHGHAPGPLAATASSRSGSNPLGGTGKGNPTPDGATPCERVYPRVHSALGALHSAADVLNRAMSGRDG
jgi:hypothetical protein